MSGVGTAYQEMKRLLGLMERIKRKPAAEQLALIRAHVTATAQAAAMEAE